MPQSPNGSEQSKDFRPTAEFAQLIKINTPTVASDRTQLYPRLAGSNWTSYLTQPTIIIGRSGANGKNTPDIDFGNATKSVSRKHCEIRFSSRRDRWELVIYSRNGVLVNRVMKGPKGRPIALETGTLIEINHTSFVFVLPSGALKPTEELQTAESPEEGNTPNTVDESIPDIELEHDVVRLFDNNETLSTIEMLEKLKIIHNKRCIEESNIIHLLVLSSKFTQAPGSSKESDSVKWMLVPQGSPHMPTTLSKSFDDEDDMLSTPSNDQSQPETRIPFRSIPLEHIYSIWTEFSSQEDERLDKRSRDDEEEDDIFKRVRTTIL